MAKAPSKSKSTTKKRVRKASGGKPATRKTTKRAAKKTVSKKTVAKKTTNKKAPAKKSSAKRSTSKRVAKKPVAKKSKAKKSASKRRPTASKATTKKAPASKRPVNKNAKKKVAKKKIVSKKVVKKKTKAKVSSAKAASTKKPAGKKTAKKTPTKKPVKAPSNASPKARTKTASKPTTKNASKPSGTTTAAGAKGKPARKGITIVQQKPIRRTSPRRPPPPVPRIGGGGLPTLGSVFGKPLIPSGPAASAPAAVVDDASKGKKRKSPFTKRQLDKFKKILIKKRNELIGGVADLESEALMGSSGSLSKLPQHMAEQGSEAADQTLSLNLAAAERRLIREIDDALARIISRTYGLCEMTGKAINPERLEELPWTRYSIEAARELERRSYRS